MGNKLVEALHSLVGQPDRDLNGHPIMVFDLGFAVS
jgi:hypothetical protein